MSNYTPPSVIVQLRRVIPRVNSGELTVVQAGEFLTGLNSHPDIDDVTDERVEQLIGILGPNIEVDEYGPCDVLESWADAKKLLEQVLSEHPLASKSPSGADSLPPGLMCD
ncbi:hypothetical protein ACWECC_25025 [Streptomyces microflavus]